MSQSLRPPEVLLFDVMGTIVREPFLAEVPEFFGQPRERLLPLLSRAAWFEFEKGVWDEPTFAAHFFKDGRDFDLDGLKAALVGGYDFLAGVEGLLGELVALSLPIHALSNYPIWYQLIEAKLRLSRYLEWSFVSCRTGVRKPDPEAYLGAARALSLPPERCLFIDDRGGNCKAAAAVGMMTIKFGDSSSLRGELTEHGVAISGAGDPR